MRVWTTGRHARPASGRTRPGVDRISAADQSVLVTDIGPAPMNVGAALVLDPAGAGFDATAAAAVLAQRSAAVPRLRQRLMPAPRGFGRPFWVDVEAFDPARHITVQPCPSPYDRQALVDLATEELLRPLPRSRPLWRAVLVPGMAEDRVGLVLVLHHVLADGIGGLAVLAALADPGGHQLPPDPSQPTPSQPTPSHPTPSRADLARDRLRAWHRALRGVPDRVRRLGRARAELGLGRATLAPATSLNLPTGPHRHVCVVETALDEVRAAARLHGATVNDLLLVAVTEAMRRLLAERDERVPRLVVSVPITARPGTSLQDLGNQVGVVPIAVGLSGPLPERLAQVAADRATQVAGAVDRGASADLVGPVFRMLVAVGAFRGMVNRQRLVNTFLTNLRGPAQPERLLGATIRSITPLSTTAGNVTCAFAALSYAGTLTVSVVTDPDRVPDHDQLAEALRRSLAALVAPG